MEKFFEHHLQTVAARLERNTDAALKRQRDAWRDALHRQAVLDEKELESFREERSPSRPRRFGVAGTDG